MLILNKKLIRKGLPKESAIFSTEACTIERVLDTISESNHNLSAHLAGAAEW